MRLSTCDDRERLAHWESRKIMKQICVALSVLAALSACARGLSHQQAQHIIESSPLVKPSDDHVAVDAISSPSPAEAIVRATIAGETVNLKFRK